MIKMIVTDIDGTFYDDNRYFDKKRFSKIQRELQKRDIQFVVASGNQYAMLHNLFDNDDSIHYIAENGALSIASSKVCNMITLTTQEYLVSLNTVLKMPCFIVVSANEHAYVLNSSSNQNKINACTYFSNVKYVQRLEDIHDNVFKISLVFDPSEADIYEDQLQHLVTDTIDVVSSGYGYIDIVKKGCNKGSALIHLLDKLQLDKETVMVFGDQANDDEMLEVAGIPFVMENGSSELKEKYKNIAPANSKYGVIAVIEEYLNDSELFFDKYK